MAFLSGLALIIIIVFLVVRRTWQGISGSEYSVKNLFMRPVIYIVLTILLVFGLAVWQDALLVVMVVAGALLGLILGKKTNISERNGKVWFRRSTEVTMLWLVAYMIRIGIDFAFNPAFSAGVGGSSEGSISSIFLVASSFEANPIIFGADILLAFTAGLLIGEALVLYQGCNLEYKK